MKIKFDIDVTPQELRTFLGLPDVEPLQQEMLELVRQKIQSGMEGLDPMAMMKPWLPQHLQTVEAFQSLWQALQRGQGSRSEAGTGDA